MSHLEQASSYKQKMEIVTTGGYGNEGMESIHKIVEFLFRIMNQFWKWTVVMVAQ
jgi:hypothetical protein